MDTVHMRSGTACLSPGFSSSTSQRWGGVAKIDFGYNVGSVVWYDSVSIRPYAPVEKAYILAGPVTTPIGTVASLELVLCGYGVVPDYSGFGASSKHQQETTPKSRL